MNTRCSLTRIVSQSVCVCFCILVDLLLVFMPLQLPLCCGVLVYSWWQSKMGATRGTKAGALLLILPTVLGQQNTFVADMKLTRGITPACAAGKHPS